MGLNVYNRLCAALELNFAAKTKLVDDTERMLECNTGEGLIFGVHNTEQAEVKRKRRAIIVAAVVVIQCVVVGFIVSAPRLALCIGLGP